ncbi:sugar phosphate isomerase/epimerase [Brevibacillus brevis]|uniref:Sugar phosphate isomerase/epimerase n=1 Tax=Brevibacillus brevis TaxID=1393 RepID=A0ABY9TA94_BREBE|nr:sugar phosphate isomerase/epimerase [Brevibacillus brevis]WNC17015.1 sugar phosphate isomerase/epimerase [Brevibacillus brevis]
MRIGLSLQSPFFTGKPGAFDSKEWTEHLKKVEHDLDFFQGAGISSIEIRNLLRGADERMYRDVIQLIWERGLQLTVHGHVGGVFSGTSFMEIYPSMRYILRHFHRYQKGITMTLHAFEASEGSRGELHRRTVDLLGEWASMVQAEGLPVQFALEINRRKPKKVDPGDSLDGVFGMVEEAGSPAVGICWDMGHSYSNLLADSGRRETDPPDIPLLDLPPEPFLKQIIHTHIHGLGTGGTHLPLTEKRSLPLEAYVSALRQTGYQGVYNMEFTFSKFDSDRSLHEHLHASIQRMKAALAPAPRPPA